MGYKLVGSSAHLASRNRASFRDGPVFDEHHNHNFIIFAHGRPTHKHRGMPGSDLAFEKGTYTPKYEKVINFMEYQLNNSSLIFPGPKRPWQ